MSITISGVAAESSPSLESLHPCRQFTIAEIQLVTNNFDESSVIGRGGFGKVYQGTITNAVTRLDVAVKRLDTTSKQGALEFWAEVKMLSKLRHPHLVSLIGYCNDMQEMILIYEFMHHGSLEDYLHKLGTSLTWVRRLKICIGAARGLDYLHTGTGINHGVIHRDVKSSNILLDDTWAAKISDFGLSKIGPINQADSVVNTLVKGTFGYLDPDYYQTGRLTRKSDVYAFGVVLFEVLCEKKAVDRSLDEEQWGNLARWAQDSIKEGRLKQIVDHNISEKISPTCLKKFAQLAVGCLLSHPKQRPTMAEVVVALEYILALQVKEDDKLQARSMTIFGKKMSPIVFPSNRDNSVGVKSLNGVELYLTTLQDENQVLRRFHFDTIQVATRNFDEDNRIFDAGTNIMYKGRLQNGHDITVLSRLNYYIDIDDDLINEVSILVKLKHKNLIELVGYCIGEEDIVYLVYNFPLHTTLHNMIHDRLCTLFDWNKRYKILLGIARVLVYLHNQAPGPIIHGDLKPQNIVLDESFYPKLSNFWKASQIDETDCTRVDWVPRTPEYVAPELLLRSCLSTKVDVYSFGLLVLETITGRHASEINRLVKCNNYQDWKNLSQGPISDIIDSRIAVDSCSIERFIKIGLSCIVFDPVLRPTMEEVVNMFLDESCVFLFLQKQEQGLLEWYSHYLFISHIDYVIVVAPENDYDTVAIDDFKRELSPR